jgi:hypothetical protein
MIIGVLVGRTTVGADVIFGRCVAVRVGDGIGVTDGEGTSGDVAGTMTGAVEVERAIVVGAIVTAGASSGELQAANTPISKNSIKRILGTTHLATGHRTKAIVRRIGAPCPSFAHCLAYATTTFAQTSRSRQICYLQLPRNRSNIRVPLPRSPSTRSMSRDEPSDPPLSL